MVLLLHNRYRVAAGEERAVENLRWLLRQHMGIDAELLERDSNAVDRPRAALGLLRGGVAPGDVAAAVRRTGARVVHAHNVHPTFGWRALAAARDAGARVVLHLHNYRLVCAVGTCFTEGAQCTRCHGANTLPGIVHNCRSNAAEAVTYGAALSLWQRRLCQQADAFVVPSQYALRRLRALGAPIGDDVHVIGHVVRDWVDSSTAASGRYALVAARLMTEKGIDIAIAACRMAGVPLVVAGAGPAEGDLRRLAEGTDVTFAGAVSAERLSELRRDAGLAIVPSRFAETFGLAAAEAMASGLPVVASDVGALGELVAPQSLVPPGDVSALARAITETFRDAAAGDAALARSRERLAPEPVAAALTRVYESL